MKLIRSPFFYVGDKFKLLPQLLDNFPKDINIFIEPFCGGGSVFLNTNAREYLLNDIDYYMISLHKYISSFCNNKEDFFRNLIGIINKYKLSASFIGQLTPCEYKERFKKTYYAEYNKNCYYRMRDDFNNDKNNLILLYLLLIYGFNRMLRFNSKGEFNLPVGNVDFNYNVKNALDDYLNSLETKKVCFYNHDFETFICDINYNEDDFIYLDPPYLISSCEYNKMWNINHEERLLNLLDDLNNKNVRFAISNVIYHRNNHNDIFEEWSKKYNVVNIKSNYINYHDNTEKNSVEVLVKNYN